MTAIRCKRPQVTDAQIAILADIEATFHHLHGYTRTEGASQAGIRRKPLQALIDAGHVTRWSTGDPDTDGGPWRLLPTETGLAQLRRAVAHRLLVLPWLERAEAEGALF